LRLFLRHFTDHDGGGCILAADIIASAGAIATAAATTTAAIATATTATATPSPSDIS
jgi:hypothetical protein